MVLTSYSDSIYSLLPPAVALLMAILTRRVLLSLACGIILGALLLTQGSIVQSFQYIAGIVAGLVWSNGHLKSSNVNILVFLVLLGAMTALMQINGSTHAFAKWARKRIKTQKGASLLTALLCFVIFIDDYFHSLAVGSIARPLTDHANVSRAKLAYLLDSTAAPMCVIMPISSWGAYIIAQIGDILQHHGFNNITPLNAFIDIIPLNFYAIFALICAFAVAYFNINIGSMAKHEQNAAQGQLYDTAKGAPAGTSSGFDAVIDGSPLGLILPLIILALVTFSAFIVTGYQGLDSDASVSLLNILKQTDVPTSLVMGGIGGLLTSIIFSLYLKARFSIVSRTLIKGAYSMAGAILVLFFAWTIAQVIHQVNTGVYLSNIVKSAHIAGAWLPVILFIIAGIMAFATGTSWGTFGVMLPIAGDIAGAAYPDLMLPVLAAVLAGSVFGDHCSPISDTTILSSTGAGCHHIDHVTTQFPYAFFTAAVAAIGYVVVGFSENVFIALSSGLILLVAGLVWFNLRSKQQSLLALAQRSQ
ncbi:Na+/H+ antiporter NhaC family protein [Celerinatantimonas sp. MCCC 1A17872]|uniref:Na+/H+ antiporter NhaC family protein n=1 Tax=Celerinatantimonas sp. MCCC 1A17872 TaxID=3177514 RepID=UPI0038C8599B